MGEITKAVDILDEILSGMVKRKPRRKVGERGVDEREPGKKYPVPPPRENQCRHCARMLDEPWCQTSEDAVEAYRDGDFEPEPRKIGRPIGSKDSKPRVKRSMVTTEDNNDGG